MNCPPNKWFAHPRQEEREGQLVEVQKTSPKETAIHNTTENYFTNFPRDEKIENVDD